MSLESVSLPTPELGPDPAPVQSAPEAPSPANPFDALKQPGDAFYTPKDAPFSQTHEYALMEPPADGRTCRKTELLENGLFRTSNWGGDDAPEDDGEAAEDFDDLVEDWTEDGVARRVLGRHGADILYCHDIGTWFVWDGTVWRRDVAGQVMGFVRAAVRDGQGFKIDSRQKAKSALFAFGVEHFVRDEPDLAARSADFDAHPFRLGTPGGTVDLATGVLAPADSADRITRATAVTPAETADCPLWRRFLDEIMGGDRELIGFLQRYLGYALTGDTSEHALVYGLGEGGNGKSLFANVVRGILGDYAIVAAPDLFARGAETRAGKAHSAEIAMLAGARLVTASETEEGRTWADGRMKLLTGGDPLTARFVRSDFTTFTPRFKLLVIGNHMPSLRIVDAAIRRRLCIVPFAHTPAEPDRRLEDKLKSEWPGILRWMIEGCLAWRAEGLGRPARVRAATADYLGSQDMVGQFLEERCETGGDHTEPSGALFAAWCAFARAAGETPGTQRRFAVQLERHGLTRERTRHARIYRGLRLLSEDEREHWSGRDDLFRARAAIVACLAQRAARG